MTPLLSVENLAVHFALGRGQTVRAVDDVSFGVARGETLGLVGESGCGKSTTGRAILRLVSPTAGRVVFDGHDVFALAARPLRALRRRMQIVFQDPFASLSPRMTVGQIVAEPLEIHNLQATRRARAERVDALLESVGLGPAAARRFAHEFSGGQRQRIGIARALALDPDFLVLDEPVSALDISVRAQIVNLLQELQETRGIAFLFVGHDLSLIRRVAHRVAVMYGGRIVEIARADALYVDPRHPYTRSLLASVPVPDPARREKQRAEYVPPQGDPFSSADIYAREVSGCRFRVRCPFAQEVCAREDPPLAPIHDENGEAHPVHLAACHFADTLPRWEPLGLATAAALPPQPPHAAT